MVDTFLPLFSHNNLFYSKVRENAGKKHVIKHVVSNLKILKYRETLQFIKLNNNLNKKRLGST